MRERLPCEFFVIRYVPDAVKGEFVNIGVVLREVGGGASADLVQGQAVSRFTRDWTRVRCMDSDADVEMLESLEQELVRRLNAVVGATDPKHVLDTWLDLLSNAIQITPARACLAESIPAELDQLMRMYVEPLKTPRTRVQTGRASLVGAVRSGFERAGVWEAMSKRIAAARYTSPGDPLKLDCGYRSAQRDRDLVKIFHAVSLRKDVEAAKSLAFTAPDLIAGVLRVEGGTLELTAVVEGLRTVSEESDEAAERYRFGVETMERQAIRVVTVADLARVAEAARRDLGM